MTEYNAKLTGSEWPVMECLWEKSPRTVVQIAKALEKSMGWAKSTSTTMITRMEAKGMIYHTDGIRAKQYYPAVGRDFEVTCETTSFLNKVYNGSIGKMIVSMIEHKNLTKEEIDELYMILKKAEEEIIN